MAEFQENLGSPSDYQRPVKTQQEGVNIFGAAADLFRGFNQANRAAASNAPSAAEQRAEATAQGLDIFSAGVAAMKTDGQNEPGNNILSFFGADAKTLFEQMKTVDEAAKDGAISPDIRKIQLEKLVSGVMGLYPEASSEIMGQALSQLGIDHIYGRAYNANTLMQEQIDKDAAAIFSTRVNLAAGLGYTGSPEMLAQRGQEIQEARRIEEVIKRWTELRTARLDAESKLTDAERVRAEAMEKKLESQILSGTVEIAALTIAPTLEKLGNLSKAAGSDPEKNKEFIEALQTARNALVVSRERTIAMLSARGITDTKALDEWFNTNLKSMDDFINGALSNDKTVLTMHNLIKNTNAIEDSQIASTYQKMVRALGAPLIHGILDGSLIVEGITSQDLKFLADDLVKGFSDGSYKFEDAQAKVMAAKSALNGTDITAITNEAERKEVLSKALQILMPATKVLAYSEAPSSKEIKNFHGTSLSLGTAIYADAPTMTNENFAKVAPAYFSGGWRQAARKALDSQDVAAAEQNVQYNVVTAAKTLESYQQRYLTTGMVQYDSKRQAYIPMPQPAPAPLSARQLESGLYRRGVTTGSSAVPKEVAAAAKNMNLLLDHISKVDEDLIDIVSDEKLQEKTTGPDGTTNYTYSTVKDVFATDSGFLTSLANFESFRKEPEGPSTPAFKEQARALVAAIEGKMVSQGNLFDLSQVTSSPAYLQASIDAAEITLGARQNEGIRIVPTDLKSYKMTMRTTEAGPNIKPGEPHDLTRSSASGHYGFLNQYQAMQKNPNAGPGTWDDVLGQIKPETKKMSPKERYELMLDPAIEEQVMDYFTIANAKALKNAFGYMPSWDEVNIAHLLGPEGAVTFLKAFRANPLAPARSALSERAANANPELSKGTLLDLWNKRLKRKDKGWEDYANRRIGIEEAPMPANNYIDEISDADLEELFSIELGAN